MNTLSHHHPTGLQYQQGIGTLFISITLLFLASLIVVTVARTGIVSTQISANDVRSRQALEAAQEGIDEAFRFIEDGGNPLTANLNTTQYRVAFCSPNDPPAPGVDVCPNTLAGAIQCNQLVPGGSDPDGTPHDDHRRQPLVISCGFSDDGVGRRGVQVQFGLVSGGPAEAPPNPLLAKGAINVQGSANVVNTFTNLTIWSGGSLENIGNSGKTFIRDPRVPPPALDSIPPTPPNTCRTGDGLVCLTDKNNTGTDVIDNDPTLANLSNDDLFRNFYGTTPSAFRAEEELTADQISSLSSTSSGIIRINAGGPTGTAVSLPGGAGGGGNCNIGSRTNPISLIIDGNLDLRGSPALCGTIYVTGNVSGGGNLLIYGAMIVQGNVAPTGSVDIIYDPLVARTSLERDQTFAPVAGSWRDWYRLDQ